MRARRFLLPSIALALALCAWLGTRAAREERSTPGDGAGPGEPPDAPVTLAALEPHLPAPPVAREPAPAVSAARPEPEPLLAGAPFWGRVVDDESGAPLQDARVEPCDEHRTFGNDRGVTTDANGCFRWGVPAGMQEELHVNAAGHAMRLVWTRPGHEGAALAREIRLLRGAAVDVRVTGWPETRGRLRLRIATPRDALAEEADLRPFRPAVMREVPVSSAGQAQAQGLVPHTALALELHGPEGLAHRSAEPLVLEPGETRALAIALGAGARVTVRARDALGRPVAGRVLLLLQRTEVPCPAGAACYLQLGDSRTAHARAETDADGRAEFARVHAGVWWVGPEKLDPDAEEPLEAVAPVATPFELNAFERERELTLELDRGLYLRGRLLAPSGEPWSRAAVGCEHAEVLGFVTGEVAEDGTFALGPVAAGVSLVRAIPYGVFAAPEPLRAMPDGREIVLTLEPGAALWGTVVDAHEGSPVRAEIVCSRTGDASSPSATIGDTGAFRFSGLAAGTYRLLARTTDGRAGSLAGLELAAGAARGDLRLEVHAAARLSLRTSGGPSRVSCQVRTAGALVAWGELQRGVTSSWWMPPEAFTITLTAEGSELAVREVSLGEQESFEAVFELE